MEDREVYKPKLESDDQIIAALRGTGAGFEAKGGISLMLCEPVENGQDAIQKSNENGQRHKNEIVIYKDNEKKRIIITDDGAGFQNVAHVCEKPFESLKKYDKNQTGQFARGIQGFRSFCNKLTFITKRMQVPPEDKVRHKIAILDFNDDRNEVFVDPGDEEKFSKYLKSPHGTIVLYDDWKKGEFEKINVDMLKKRVEHHFGELIRKGSIKISIIDGKKKIMCNPKDYSKYEKLKINPVPVKNDEGKMIGEVVFELYLTGKGKRDKWLLPYLLYQDRPAGDGHIRDLEEFEDSAVWNSPFLTGFIRCDFCEINELRLALKPGFERDVLYSELENIEPQLENEVKRHAKGVFELKLQKEITELVYRLQTFIKKKNVLNFKPPRAAGYLKDGKDLREINAATSGGDGISAVPNSNGEITGDMINEIAVTNTEVGPGNEKDRFGLDTSFGGHGNNHSSSVTGHPEDGAGPGNENGFEGNSDGVTKPHLNTENFESGDDKKTRKRKVRKHPLKGFTLHLDDDEFNDDLSWYDPVTSTIVINSGHERYRGREKGENEPRKNKTLMDYLAELYLWEISKLVYKNLSSEELGRRFLGLKFEFFEEEKQDKQ